MVEPLSESEHLTPGDRDEGRFSQSHLIVINLPMFDFPLVPHFVQGGRRPGKDQAVQKQQGTQDVHPVIGKQNLTVHEHM